MAKRKSKSRSVSSSSMACQACESSCKCKAWSWLLALVAVIFLAQDMGWLSMWGMSWPLNWWTVAALLLGVKALMKSYK